MHNPFNYEDHRTLNVLYFHIESARDCLIASAQLHDRYAGVALRNVALDHLEKAEKVAHNSREAQ